MANPLCLLYKYLLERKERRFVDTARSNNKDNKYLKEIETYVVLYILAFLVVR